MDIHEISMNCKRTEFVGTAVLDTIGLCIAGVDDTLLQTMNIGTRYHALGLFSSRTGAAGQLTAMDEAVKSTGTEVLSIDFPRDTKGWGGHGNYIVIGGDSVSDVRDAIRTALDLTNMAGSPAAIGLVMADTAMKAASVQIARYMTPSLGTSHSNEVILVLSGTAQAAKEAVLSAHQIGLELLIAMGSYPEIPGTPYLV